MALTITLGSKNRSNIMETIIINPTIGIPIITITEVFHGTDKNIGFEDPQQHKFNSTLGSKNRSPELH